MGGFLVYNWYMPEEQELMEKLLNDLHLAIYQEAVRLIREATAKGDEIIFDPDQIRKLRGVLENYLANTMQTNSSIVKEELVKWAQDPRWEISVKIILPNLVEHLFSQESIKPDLT